MNSNHNRQASEIIHDIEYMIAHNDTEHVFLTNHILNKLIQLTGSEHGFLAILRINKETGEQFLQSWSISFAVWSKITFDVYKTHQNKTGFDFSLEHDTLFKEVITSNDIVIENDYPSRLTHFIPLGHPQIRRFMGVPIQVGSFTIGMVGLANRLTPYARDQGELAREILNHLSLLFINVSPCAL